MSTSYLTENKSTFGAWAWLILAILYDLSPIDIIPDIPVVGWIDDFLITVTAGLNMIQVQLENANSSLTGIFTTLKWIAFILSIIVILLVALLGVAIAALFVN